MGNRQRISKKQASTIPRSSRAGGARRAPTPAARIHSAEKRRKTEWNSYQSCGSSLRYCIQTHGSPRPLGALCSCSADGRCDENRPSFCRVFRFGRVLPHEFAQPLRIPRQRINAAKVAGWVSAIIQGAHAHRRGLQPDTRTIIVQLIEESFMGHASCIGQLSNISQLRIVQFKLAHKLIIMTA